METHILVLALGLGLTALLSWAAVARGDYTVEQITRPTFLLLLGGLAWALAEDAGSGSPDVSVALVVLVGLSLVLVGDLLLLTATEARYAFALLVLVLANVAWGWAVLSTHRTPGLPWWVLPVLLVIFLVHGRWGRDIVRFAGRQRGLVLLATLSQLVLALLAAWLGDLVVLLGAALALAGLTLLGHDRFVLERRWAPTQALVALNAGQVALVLGFLR